MITTNWLVCGLIGVLIGIIALTVIFRWYYLHPRASNNWLDKYSYGQERWRYINGLIDASDDDSWELFFVDKVDFSKYVVERPSDERISVVRVEAIINVKRKLVCFPNKDICGVATIVDVFGNHEETLFSTESYSEFLRNYEHKVSMLEYWVNIIVTRIILRK